MKKGVRLRHLVADEEPPHAEGGNVLRHEAEGQLGAGGEHTRKGERRTPGTQNATGGCLGRNTQSRARGEPTPSFFPSLRHIEGQCGHG